MRKCTRCGSEKPATTDYFNRHPQGRNGLQAQCRVCTSLARRLIRRGISTSRKPAAPAGNRVCRTCGKTKFEDDFYGNQAVCKVCTLAAQKSRYQQEKVATRLTSMQAEPFRRCSKCGEEFPATAANFYRHWKGPGGLVGACKGCVNRVVKERRPVHRDRMRAHQRNYRARKAGASGNHSKADVQKAFRAQCGRCWWCRKRVAAYHVDHRIPLSRGGSNGPENLVISCPTCNLSRNNKLPWEMEDGRLV